MLSGSEVFMLIMAGITACSGFVVVCFQFILKSRCTHIKLCGSECICDVLPASESVIEIPASMMRSQSNR